MKISKINIDSLNLLIDIELSKKDFAPRVESVLKQYARTASLPGFRKGNIPMGLVQKKYGKAVQLEEINKILQEELYQYLQKEKIQYLGNPIPISDKVDLDAETIPFQFELGLKPEVKVSLKTKKTITHYQIEVDEDFVQKEVIQIQKHFGKITHKESIEKEEDEITGTFKDENNEVIHKNTFELSILTKKNQKLLQGKKKGDVVSLDPKDLVEKNVSLEKLLKLSKEDLKNLSKINLSVEEINQRELAEINQELFDKTYGKDVVKSLSEMKEKIKETYSQRFQNQADQYFMNQMTETLIEETEVLLPESFLKKWLYISSKEGISEEGAAKEFEDSKKSIKYQIIENQILQDNDIKLEAKDLRDFAANYIREQMANFGRTDASDEEINSIAERILSNQEEAKRLSSELLSQKLLELYKANDKLSVKKVTFEEFVKEVYT